MDTEHVKSQFLASYAAATTVVLHDDGLYRHVRVSGSHYFRFELVTWPGSLFINCEGDGFTFARTADMFDFFRHGKAVADLDPNFSYWAEKLYDSRSQKVRAFDYEAFEKDIEAVIATITDEARRRDIRRDLEWETGDDESSCRAFSSRHAEFANLRIDGDWSDWTFRFAYACFAICFGIREYDRLKAASPTSGLAPAVEEAASEVDP